MMASVAARSRYPWLTSASMACWTDVLRKVFSGQPGSHISLDGNNRGQGNGYSDRGRYVVPQRGSLKPWVLLGVALSLILASDIALAAPKFSEWSTPINLGPAVNSASLDIGASYFANDDFGVPLLFFGSDRPGGPGGTDIYVSAQQPDGSFGAAELVNELSSPFSDNRPVVRFDGLELFLFSDRPDGSNVDMWVSTRNSVFDPWSTPVNLCPTVYSPQDDRQAYIASDRMTLFFASDRPGGVGGFDLYMTTRSK